LLTHLQCPIDSSLCGKRPALASHAKAKNRHQILNLAITKD